MSSTAPLPGGDDPWKAHLAAMTTEEKCELVMRIWEDLGPALQSIESPAWHREVLESRRRAIEDGTATFIDWEEAEREFDALE